MKAKRKARGSEFEVITPDYDLASGHQEKSPKDWDESGNITAWQESNAFPVRADGGKVAWDWNEHTNKVGHWAYTLPPKRLELIPWAADGVVDALQAANKSFEPAMWENYKRFTLGPLSDVPTEVIDLLNTGSRRFQ